MLFSGIIAALTSLLIPIIILLLLLPNACCSEICVKMNLRELIHFANERLCACAQWEIRAMAREMVRAVAEVAPELKAFLVPKCEKHAPYCFCTESKSRSCGRHPLIGEVCRKDEKPLQ